LRTSKIILYDEPAVPEIQIEKLQNFLKELFPVQIEIRKNFSEYSNDKIFEKIASSKIHDIKKPFKKYIPSINEIQAEKECKDTTKDEEMILYDGFEFQKIISDIIPKDENKLNILHIIFTNKLTCTFDDSDFRYHARAIIKSSPAIISTSGIVEAPAKPKQYYFELMTDFSKDKIDEIKKKYKGEFLEYNDSRISQVIEGYLLQAIMYFETGDSFCDDKECRLFNAHWQKDLLHSQIVNQVFCKKHLEIIKKITNN
jgi:hypothetical protein